MKPSPLRSNFSVLPRPESLPTAVSMRPVRSSSSVIAILWYRRRAVVAAHLFGRARRKCKRCSVCPASTRGAPLLRVAPTRQWRTPMRLAAPRIAPLRDEELTDDQREALAPMTAGGRPLLNIFRTLARAPKALARFNEWGGYVLSRRNSLPTREREIVILRVGFLCKSGYEFTQHTRIGLNEGLTEAEIAKIKQGADAGWSAADAALIRAADELVTDHFVTN